MAISGGGGLVSPVAVADGGTGSITAANARTALGVDISSNENANLFLSAGVISAADINNIVIMSATAGAVDVTAFTTFLRTSASISATLVKLTASVVTALAVPLNTTRYILATYNAGVVSISASATDTSNGWNIISLALAVNESGVIHMIVPLVDMRADATNLTGLRWWEINGIKRASGAILSEPAALKVAVTSGVFWAKLHKLSTATFNSNAGGTFFLHYVTAGVWTMVTGQSSIPVTQYNNITTGLVNMTTNNYYSYYDVYLGSTDGDVRLMYGQGEYTTQGAAEAAPLSASFPVEISPTIYQFIGRIVFKKNGIAATSILSAYASVLQLASSPTAAVQISNTPAGNIASLNVQDAINELDSSLLRKNYVMNGNFDVWQRGIAAVTVDLAYGADRWFHQATGNTNSWTREAFISGDALYDPTAGNTAAAYYSQIVVTSNAGAANCSLLDQRMENVRLLAGKTITVSFWAKAAAGTPLIGVSIDQFFGTGGSAYATGVGQSVTLSTAWTKYSKTFTVPSLNGKTIGTATTDYTQLLFWLDAGSSYNTRSGTIGQATKTVSIGQVQIELGSLATEFEFEAFSETLTKCQRYLPSFVATAVNQGVWVGQATAATTAKVYIPFSTPARIAPTGLTISAAGDFYLTTAAFGLAGTVSALVIGGNHVDGCNITVTTSTGLVAGDATMLGSMNANARLYFTGAEL